MYNLNSYVEKYLYTFEEKPFNEIDSIILCWLTYYHIHDKMYKKNSFDSFKIKDFYNLKYMEDMTYDVFDRPSSTKLLSLLAGSPRFRDIDMMYYIETTSKKIEKQFSAMTFKISPNEYYVAYRGTDHTFVAWKEDFNMAFLKSIPAQIDAKNYLDKVMKKFKGRFYVGGHSKGGNLAVYAAINIDDKLKKRINKVYSLDGPGFRKDAIDLEKYEKISPIIEKYVPQSSVVGMIFEDSDNYNIIKSNSIGVIQHCPFTWEIDNNKLKTIKDSTFDSKNFKTSLNALVNTLSEDELKTFVNSIYSIFDNTESDSIEELIKNANKTIPIIFKSIKDLDNTQKESITKVASVFVKESIQHTVDSIKNIKFDFKSEK